ncbi:MAG: hypothetical protein O7D86_13875 [Proteobacteria bacterium]|nr:hypothetical protein [Pseudomonadota bacterium]
MVVCVSRGSRVAAFFRDSNDDRKALKIVENAVREMTDEPGFREALDEEPESMESHRVRLALWKFTKSPHGLPSVSKNGTGWINSLRTQ